MVCVLHEKLKLTCIYIKYVLFIVRKLKNMFTFVLHVSIKKPPKFWERGNKTRFSESMEFNILHLTIDI